MSISSGFLAGQQAVKSEEDKRDALLNALINRGGGRSGGGAGRYGYAVAGRDGTGLSRINQIEKEREAQERYEEAIPMIEEKQADEMATSARRRKLLSAQEDLALAQAEGARIENKKSRIELRQAEFAEPLIRERYAKSHEQLMDGMRRQTAYDDFSTSMKNKDAEGMTEAWANAFPMQHQPVLLGKDKDGRTVELEDTEENRKREDSYWGVKPKPSVKFHVDQLGNVHAMFPGTNEWVRWEEGHTRQAFYATRSGLESPLGGAAGSASAGYVPSSPQAPGATLPTDLTPTTAAKMTPKEYGEYHNNARANDIDELEAIAKFMDSYSTVTGPDGFERKDPDRKDEAFEIAKKHLLSPQAQADAKAAGLPEPEQKLTPKQAKSLGKKAIEEWRKVQRKVNEQMARGEMPSETLSLRQYAEAIRNVYGNHAMVEFLENAKMETMPADMPLKNKKEGGVNIPDVKGVDKSEWAVSGSKEYERLQTANGTPMAFHVGSSTAWSLYRDDKTGNITWRQATPEELQSMFETYTRTMEGIGMSNMFDPESGEPTMGATPGKMSENEKRRLEAYRQAGSMVKRYKMQQSAGDMPGITGQYESMGPSRRGPNTDEVLKSMGVTNVEPEVKRQVDNVLKMQARGRFSPAEARRQVELILRAAGRMASNTPRIAGARG